MRAFATCLFLLIGVTLQAAEPPKSPLSPEESLKHLVLGDPNLLIEIVAAEPEVIDPVAIQFDEHGRLWVVEMRDYPTGPKEAPPPLGGPDAKPLSRIKLLEDKDGDGRFETAHVFADNLLFATGVQPWDGGVIVTLAGEVAYFKDTDGDHKADVRETWFTGFAQANTQLRANHPTFGPDGWIYVANGLRGGNVIAVKKDWPRSPDAHVRTIPSKKNQEDEKSDRSDVGVRATEPQPVSLTGRDFKFDPLTGRYDAISGNGQFGMTFDAWGNRFVCDNRHPCRHVIFEEDFIKRCPHVAFPAMVHDVIPDNDKNRVFPLTSAWTTSNLHAGTFTAACGVTVYTGDWLPEEFRGNVFVCEPTGNLVQRAILEPDGVTFKSRRGGAGFQPARPSSSESSSNSTTTKPKAGQVENLPHEAEFLASRDDWFRPVDLQNGPDGALYVVDMYRAVIEHPEWVPDELKKRPDTWLGNDKGRIYRIRPKGIPRKTQKLDTDWWRDFGTSNGWDSVTSRRKRREKDTGDEFICPVPGWVERRQHDPRIRERLLQERILLAERLPETKAEAKAELREWAADSNVRVRFRAVQAMQIDSSDDDDTASALARIAAQDAHDPFARMAIIAATGQQQTVFLKHLLHQFIETPELWQRQEFAAILANLFELIGARNANDELNDALGMLDKAWRLGPEESFGGVASSSIGLAIGLGRKGETLHGKQLQLDARAKSALDSLIDNSMKFALSDAAQAAANRLPAIQLLRHGPFVKVSLPLKQVAETTTDQSLRLAAVESFASFQKAEVDAWLVERYRSETPAIRRAILAALFASKERQLRLLEAIEQGQIAATELDPVRVNQLTQAKDETLRARAKTVLAAAAPASRHEVLDAYRPALALTADPKRGREVFVKNCSTCHRVDNVGVNVAPDISDTRTKKPDQLLLDILDPNKAIDANYFAYAVVTKEGKTESGVISSETATSITLKQPEGKVLTLLRADIEELRNTGISLMPVGVEKNIDQQAMADLIFWLKNWRYLDGKVPATSLPTK